MEKIIASAIRFKRTEDTAPEIWTGLRHSDIFEQMHQMGVHYVFGTAEQGFLTDTYRFVDRIEAKAIAIKAGQVITPIEQMYTQLFSEDLW